MHDDVGAEVGHHGTLDSEAHVKPAACDSDKAHENVSNVGAIQIRLIAAGSSDAGAGIVGND